MLIANSTEDKRRVVLIKSLRTKNRFYTLVDPERGIRNADTVEDIPDDLILGIAYPCLEDGLNDFAVIRTTFETLELFPTDDPYRAEMMEIVKEAQDNLVRRLTELREKLNARKAFFLGTDYNEFKQHALRVMQHGYQRRMLDGMMKLNVFCSVAEAEGYSDPNELPFFYEPNPSTSIAVFQELPPEAFVVRLFDDVLESVLDDANYVNQYRFDRNVFQKFLTVMFVNYATTDPIFYGINRGDYGVSAEKEMDNTPLYIAIRRELLAIEERLRVAPEEAVQPILAPPTPVGAETIHAPTKEMQVTLPGELVNEEVLMGPISSLCSAAILLRRKSDPETQRIARVILADAEKLVDELKRLGIISPITNNPGHVNEA